MPKPINKMAEMYLIHFSAVVSLWLIADNDVVLYEMIHAMIMIGRPVPNPKTKGNNQFQEKGSVTAISIIVKKYTKRCGQNAMAKKIPSINDQKPLLCPSICLSHFVSP